MSGREAVVRLREARRRAHNDAYAAYRMRLRLGLPPGEPDDDIPPEEAEARKAEVARVKRALERLDVDPELTIPELERLLP